MGLGSGVTVCFTTGAPTGESTSTGTGVFASVGPRAGGALISAAAGMGWVEVGGSGGCETTICLGTTGGADTCVDVVGGVVGTAVGIKA